MTAPREHQWGPWLKHHQVKRGKTYRFRFCTNGWCPMGQYRNGRLFNARPERTIPCKRAR